MNYFESNFMSKSEIDKFALLCDALIGTEYTIKQDGNDYCIVVFDLYTADQAELVKRINRHVYHGQRQSFIIDKGVTP